MYGPASKVIFSSLIFYLLDNLQNINKDLEIELELFELNLNIALGSWKLELALSN